MLRPSSIWPKIGPQNSRYILIYILFFIRLLLVKWTSQSVYSIPVGSEGVWFGNENNKKLTNGEKIKVSFCNFTQNRTENILMT